MPIRRIDVATDAGHGDTIKALAEKYEAIDFWAGPVGEDGRCTYTLLTGPHGRQKLIDHLQSLAESVPNARLVISDVQALVPAVEEQEEAGRAGMILSREELHAAVILGARLNWTYLLLTALSALVAAIGMLENNVAVIIGAMVIAPLLGPNLAMAVAVALGNLKDILSALTTGLAGIAVAFFLSVGLAQIWPHGMQSPELLLRTEVQLSSVALALASGAAAVLSLTTGLSAALVGVMVAVALLPPVVAMGLSAGDLRFDLAIGAGLLLIVNIVCVNLAAQLVLLFQGVRPRTGSKKESARLALIVNLVLWIGLLAVLIGAIYIVNR